LRSWIFFRQRQLLFGGKEIMSNLLLINLPSNASSRELREWIESCGILTKSIRIVRDLMMGLSPAFGHVELTGSVELKEAISILHGKRMRSQTIFAKEGPPYGFRKGFLVEEE
jgi:RNA recognition motif-containing protein